MNEIFALIAALGIHEAGHLLTAHVFGIRLIRFRISPVGGVLTFDFSSTGYLREAAVHFGGPLAGLIAGAAAAYFPGTSFFSGISAVLAVVNLFPVRGLDGGGICRCVLSRFLLPDTVWRVCGILSAAGVLLLWTAVLWTELRVRANLGLAAFAAALLLNETKRPED